MSFAMPSLVRVARPDDRALFAARRAFNAGFLALETALSAPKSNAGEADADEIWAAFETHLGAAFAAQDAGVWLCALQPSQRARVARLFCEIALARMQLDPHGDPALDAGEMKLWSAALSASPREVAAWEAARLATFGELGFGFAGVKHRLGDLFRRAGRSDDAALRLYIEVFTGRRALPASRNGAGAHHSVAVLLERGSALSAFSSDAEIAARYSLCLLLQSRGFRAAWVGRSLQIAREKSPDTRQNWLERVEQTPEKRARQRHKEAQKPGAARLVEILMRIAAARLEAETRRSEIERLETERLALLAATQVQAAATAEIAAEPPKRKRGRPRKKTSEDVATQTLAAEALPTEKEALQAFEMDSVATEAAARESASLKRKSTPPSATDTETFLDFDALFGELDAPKPPQTKETEAAPDNDWLSFDFGFDEKK